MKNFLHGFLIALVALVVCIALASLGGCHGLKVSTDRQEYNDQGQLVASVKTEISSRRQYKEFYLDYEKDEGVTVRASEAQTSADPTLEKAIDGLTEAVTKALSLYGISLTGKAVNDAATLGAGVLLNRE